MKRLLQVQTGQQFTRLTVCSAVFKHKNRRAVECVCVCGARKTVSLLKLCSGHTRSCGCLLREITRGPRPTLRKHGLGGTRIYDIWRGMMRRCRDPRNISYPFYGARGITVCPRWHDIRLFAEDMGSPPDGHSIGRINNDGNYEPENCRWETREQQWRNRSDNQFVEAFGHKIIMSDFAIMLGHHPTAFRDRLIKALRDKGLNPQTGHCAGIFMRTAKKPEAA